MTPTRDITPRRSELIECLFVRVEYDEFKPETYRGMSLTHDVQGEVTMFGRDAQLSLQESVEKNYAELISYYETLDYPCQVLFMSGWDNFRTDSDIDFTFFADDYAHRRYLIDKKTSVGTDDVIAVSNEGKRTGSLFVSALYEEYNPDSYRGLDIKVNCNAKSITLPRIEGVPLQESLETNYHQALNWRNDHFPRSDVGFSSSVENLISDAKLDRSFLDDGDC